jgi:hypothetical protein
VLKFLPALSPAEDLAGRTISALTLGVVAPAVSVPALAAWECAIGVGVISGQFLRATLILMFVHMSGTLTPLFLFPARDMGAVPLRRNAGRAVHHQEPGASECWPRHLRCGKGVEAESDCDPQQCANQRSAALTASRLPPRLSASGTWIDSPGVMANVAIGD